MSRRIHKSDSQANAEALVRRAAPYSSASDASFTVAWDWHRREPESLREAVRMVRRAYADEVPTKLHEAAIGEDGTPRMTARAEGYIFGSAEADDSAKGEQALTAYYLTPFRACLASHARSDEASRRRGRIVEAIADGKGPAEAAVAEGAHRLDAKLVAMDALCSFLRSMTDLKLNVRREAVA